VERDGGRDSGRRVAFIGAGCLVLLAMLGLLAPVLAPYDPALASGPPLLWPGGGHLLGTNDIGQDLLSQWLWGARASLRVALVVALLSTLLSWGVGLLAGVWARAEGPLVALVDLLLALPWMPLYLLVIALLGPSQSSVALVLGTLLWPAFARVVRAQVLAVRGAGYVEAARALGAGQGRVALVHVLPATLGLIPANLLLTVRFGLFAEATLAFLGLGDPAAPSWGTTLGWAFNDPLLFSRGTWAWWVLPPAASIALVVLATTALASGLEAWLRWRPGQVDVPRLGYPSMASWPLQTPRHTRSSETSPSGPGAATRALRATGSLLLQWRR
jgi:peptide/nickel transport system permease protein